MEMNLKIILFSTLVSLVGTMVGALIGISIKKPSENLLGNIIGFSAGLMMCITAIELVPEAIQNNGISYTIFFMLIGIVIVYIIDTISNKSNYDNNTKIAFLVALGLMIHNFPEGMIMGLGFSAGDNLGIKMSLLIAIHDIPEGIAVAAPLLVSNTNRGKILLYTFITALPTALGAWIGIFVGNISNILLGACLALAAGIMLYVVCIKMFSESRKLSGITKSLISSLTGILFGIIMIVVL